MYWARSNHSVQACDEDEYLRSQKGWENEKGKQLANEPHFLGPPTQSIVLPVAKNLGFPA